MKIVLSAHFDIKMPVPFIKITNHKLIGLIDNFAGVFAAYQAARKTGVPLYLTNFEETGFAGAKAVARKLKKDTLVIVVDTTTDVHGKAAYVGNAYNIDTEPLKKKFKKQIFFMGGLFEETEDETWIYGHTFGFKTFYFGVPIAKPYHAVNNSIRLKGIDRAGKILSNLIQKFPS